MSEPGRHRQPPDNPVPATKALFATIDDLAPEDALNLTGHILDGTRRALRDLMDHPAIHPNQKAELLTVMMMITPADAALENAVRRLQLPRANRQHVHHVLESVRDVILAAVPE